MSAATSMISLLYWQHILSPNHSRLWRANTVRAYHCSLLQHDGYQAEALSRPSRLTMYLTALGSSRDMALPSNACMQLALSTPATPTNASLDQAAVTPGMFHDPIASCRYAGSSKPYMRNSTSVGR